MADFVLNMMILYIKIGFTGKIKAAFFGANATYVHKQSPPQIDDFPGMIIFQA